MALTAAQSVSVRRYAGWGLSPATPDALDLALASLTAEQEAVVVTTFLPSLLTLELAIMAAADTLDTAKAAVWERNANELAERSMLYRYRRIDLCRFLGVDLGSAVLDPVLVVPDPCCKSSGSGTTPTDPTTGLAFTPAVFVV